MKCKKCGHIYSIENNYCNNCGNRLINNKGKIDFGLIIIFLFGLLAFGSIGYLTYYSLTTVSKNNSIVEEDYYLAITGEWLDTNHSNLLKLSNRATYNWFQDYNNDKNHCLSGSMTVKIKNDALNELNINIESVRKLFNVFDITEENVYLLKLYTSNKKISSSYYKLLCVERDEQLFIYNYNDKNVLQFSKNI